MNGYLRFGPAVAYVESEDGRGDVHVGTAFHIGDGVFVTAKHVVEGRHNLHVATTLPRFTDDSEPTPLPLVEGVPGGPFLSSRADVALLTLPSAKVLPHVAIGHEISDWLGLSAWVLDEGTLLGYPQIPQSKGPVLVAARCEINAVVDKYLGGPSHYILSSMARGGFSGAPVVGSHGILLGMVTESLMRDEHPPELGYMAALTNGPIFDCIVEHGFFSDGPIGPRDF